MFNRLWAVMCLMTLALPASSQTGEALPAPAESAEKILVVGQRPGPGMWKVSNGDHVLWIFGSYAPLPIKMEWRSHEVEAILAKSQEFIAPPQASPDISALRMVTLIPFAFGAMDIPEGKKLSDVLAPELYARWVPLKQKYLGSKDAVERLRPIFAADRLYWAALEKAGLGNGRDVRLSINSLVKKNNIPVTNPEIKLAVDSPVKTIRDFKKSSLEDSECFAKTLEQVETDIDSMKLRANAWAKGDLEAIQKLTFPDRTGACSNAVLSSSVLKNQAGFQSVDARMKDSWLAAVEKALARNQSTFAVLPMRYLLDANGYLTTLREKGYAVEIPE